MAFKDTQPTDFNLFQTNGYKLVFRRLPNTIFFLQRVVFPTIDYPPIDTGTPFQTIHHPASELKFGPLEITFKINGDFQNYRDIFNWLVGMGFPEDTSQYVDLIDDDGPLGGGLKSDASLQLLGTNNQPFREIVFRDCFPIYLGGSIEFEVRNDTANYLSAVARFSIRDFVVNDVVS